MITLEQLRHAAPEGYAESLAFTAAALIGTARLALENDTSGQEAARNVATVLGLAEQLSFGVIDGCEALTRTARKEVAA